MACGRAAVSVGNFASVAWMKGRYGSMRLARSGEVWTGALLPARKSLSGVLCAGRSMTRRSMYANQQEDGEGGHGRCGGDAVDRQGSH
jgi:hypothetical protein